MPPIYKIAVRPESGRIPIRKHEWLMSVIPHVSKMICLPDDFKEEGCSALRVARRAEASVVV
jgi:hypothetical protein